MRDGPSELHNPSTSGRRPVSFPLSGAAWWHSKTQLPLSVHIWLRNIVLHGLSKQELYSLKEANIKLKAKSLSHPAGNWHVKKYFCFDARMLRSWISRKPRPVITRKQLLFWNHKLINNTLVHTKHGFVYDGMIRVLHASEFISLCRRKRRLIKILALMKNRPTFGLLLPTKEKNTYLKDRGQSLKEQKKYLTQILINEWKILDHPCWWHSGGSYVLPWILSFCDYWNGVCNVQAKSVI